MYAKRRGRRWSCSYSISASLLQCHRFPKHTQQHRKSGLSTGSTGVCTIVTAKWMEFSKLRFRECTPWGRLRDLHGWMDRWMAKPGHGPHGTMMAWWGCPQWKPRTRAGLQTWSSGAGGQRGASDVAYKVASRRSRVARCPGPGRVRELEWKTVCDHALQRLGKRAALNNIGLGNVRERRRGWVLPFTSCLGYQRWVLRPDTMQYKYGAWSTHPHFGGNMVLNIPFSYQCTIHGKWCYTRPTLVQTLFLTFCFGLEGLRQGTTQCKVSPTWNGFTPSHNFQMSKASKRWVWRGHHWEKWCCFMFVVGMNLFVISKRAYGN